MTRICIVVIDEFDAARIGEVRSIKEPFDIVSLSPTAYFELKRRGFHATKSNEIYTNEVVSKIVDGWSSRDSALRQYARELELTQAEAHIFRCLGHNAVNCGQAIQAIVGAWTRVAYWNGDSWKIAASSAAAETICGKLFEQANNVAVRESTLIERVKKSVYFFLIGFLGPRVVMCGRARGLGEIAAKVKEFEPGARVAYVAGGLRYDLTIKDILQVFLFPFRDHPYPLHSPFFLSPSEHKELADRIADLEGDAVISGSLRAAARHLAGSVLECRGWTKQLQRIPQLRKVHSTIAWDAKAPKNAALVYFGATYCKVSAVICHATVAPGTPSVRDDQKRFANSAMVAPIPSVLSFVQSKLADLAVADAQPTAERIAVPPLLWRIKKEPKKDEPSVSVNRNRKRFLWAGNFHDWRVHQPFHQETSDEMFEGLVRLCEVFADFPHLELGISIKPNWRVSHPGLLSLIEGLARDHRNVSVMASVPFEAALLDSCCVISFSSTVIEQALYSQRPAILWGALGRSPYVPLELLDLQRNESKVVFAATQRAELIDAINAIDAMVEFPSSIQSDHRLVWGDEVNLEMAVERLLGKRDAPKWPSFPA